MEAIRTASLELGDVKLELRATVGAFARWQRAAKDAGVELGSGEMPAEMAGAMIWALLPKADREKYEPEDLLDMMSLADLPDVAVVASDLITGSLPEADEGKPKGKAKAKA